MVARAWIAACVGVFIFSAGWAANGWRQSVKIAQLKTELAEKDKKAAETHAAQSNAALQDLTNAATAIKTAAQSATLDNSNLAAQNAAILRSLRDIKNAKPLPVGCRPDDDRMRSLQSAVDATNKAVARSVPGK